MKVFLYRYVTISDGSLTHGIHMIAISEPIMPQIVADPGQQKR